MEIDIFSIGVMLFSIISTAFAAILWKIYGKDELINKTPEPYPPEDFNSAEIGFLYNGRANNESIASLLIYLADKGYLKIKDNGRFDTKIIKLKDYDGENEIEKIFFDGLFKDRYELKISELTYNFYNVFNKIKNKLNSNKDKIFENSANEKSIWVKILIVIIFIFSIFKIILSSLNIIETDSILEYILTFTVGLICIIFLIIFVKIMPKRTTYGIEMLEKIGGFKEFIENSERSELEKIIEENNNYFYYTLAYIYALDDYNKWIKKMEKIIVKTPDWYESKNLSFSNFNSFMLYTMTNIINAMTLKTNVSEELYKDKYKSK